MKKEKLCNLYLNLNLNKLTNDTNNTFLIFILKIFANDEMPELHHD